MSSKKNLGEEFAIEWLARHGLRAERFSKTERRQGKTPDFRVFKCTDFVLYCESKHVQYDEWLDKQLANAQTLEIVGGLRHDPIYNRLADRIHDAAKQFEAVNPDRQFPNVLIFTNSDAHRGFPDLLSVLTGNFYPEGGAVDPILKQISEGRIREQLARWYRFLPSGDTKEQQKIMDRIAERFKRLGGMTPALDVIDHQNPRFSERSPELERDKIIIQAPDALNDHFSGLA